MEFPPQTLHICRCPPHRAHPQCDLFFSSYRRLRKNISLASPQPRKLGFRLQQFTVFARRRNLQRLSSFFSSYCCLRKNCSLALLQPCKLGLRLWWFAVLAQRCNLDEPKVALSTEELSARFQSLVETMFGMVGDVWPLALSWTIYVLWTRACWVWLGYWQTPEANWYIYEIW